VLGDPAGVRHLDYARPEYDRAQALARKGLLEEACETYRLACVRAPESADAHFRLAETLAKLGKTEQALAELEMASRALPSSYKPHRNRAHLYEQKGEFDRAEEAFDRVLVLEPAHEDSRWHRSLLRARRGYWEGALLDLEIALGAPTRLRLAIGIAGNQSAFEVLLDRAVFAGVSEDRVDRILAYANMLAEAGRPARAVTLLERAPEWAVHLSPAARASLQSRLGEAYMRYGDFTRAGQAFGEAWRLYGEGGIDLPATFCLAWGEARSRAGEPGAAIPILEMALAREPGSARVHYALACALALSERPGDALESLSKAVDAGFRDRDHADSDPDLTALRELPEFRQLLEAMSR
jgi:tetratricopeptide (TPR) repeat protein